MAFQVAERNADCDSLVIAGIAGNGVMVAQAVIKELKQIIKCPIEFITISIDKDNPLNTSIDKQLNYDDRTIIVVDDVVNSGRILLYALKHFLSHQPKSIQTLVLIERSHKLFPVQSDYVGLSLATTLQDHITVKTENGRIAGAWLY